MTVVLAQLIVSGLVLGAIYALIALGYVIIYKATSVVNFAQGEAVMVGAYMLKKTADWCKVLKNRACYGNKSSWRSGHRELPFCLKSPKSPSYNASIAPSTGR